MVIGRLSPVTNTIEMPDKRRKDHSIHVTALKLWHRPMVNLASLSSAPDHTADIPDYSPSTDPIFPELEPHLDESQCADLRRIWDDYPLVITHSLGQRFTKLTQVLLPLSDSTPTAFPSSGRNRSRLNSPNCWKLALSSTLQHLGQLQCLQSLKRPLGKFAW